MASYTCAAGDALNGATCSHSTTTTYAATPAYGCNAGDALAGTTCTHNSASTYGATPAYACNAGDALGGSTCTHVSTGTYAATIGSYACNAGDTLAGSTCTHVATSTYGATVSGYACNAGDTLGGSTCTHTSVTAATPTYSCTSGTLSGSNCVGNRTQTTTAYVYLAGKQIAETANGVTQYVHTDALGSPVAHSNAGAVVMNRTRFEPYGYPAQGTKPGKTTSVIGFTGHVQDAETELVYMQQRYYDPVAGRFLSVDPIVTDTNTGKGFGLYTYVDNNPYSKIDPDGRNWLWAGIGAGAVLCARSPTCAAIAIGVTSNVISNVLQIASQPEAPKPNDGKANPDGGDNPAKPEGQQNGERPSKTPNTGEPGSTYVNPGSGQERTYGPDGKPVKDVDHDHDHGQGVPHQHDWVDGKRGPGKPVDPPLKPDEPKKVDK